MTISLRLFPLFISLWSSLVMFAPIPAAAESPYDLKNLAAWCIVPFDKQKRTPEERAAMVAKIGITKVAYDWRQENVPEFEREILAYQKHGIEYFAFWSQHYEAFQLFEKYGLHPQIWVMANGKGETQEERVESAAEGLLPVIAKAKKIGSKVAVYNHGGWGGEPENMVAVCEHLRQAHGVDNVGIVYNFHHGHGHLARLDEVLKLMLPHLLCVNLNGMDVDGEAKGRKILPLGVGSQDIKVLRQLRASGYDGTIGILNHTQEDAEGRLLDNLDGLRWLLPQLDDAQPGVRPAYRTWADKPAPTFSAAHPSSGGVSSLTAEFGKALSVGMLADGGASFEELPLSIEVRAKLDGKEGFNILVSSSEKASSAHWEVYTYAKTGVLSVYLPGRGGVYASGMDICDGKWHDLLVSLSDEMVRIWVDGQSVLERKPAAIAGSGGTPKQRKIGLGRLVEGTIGCKGIIDDVRISRGVIEPATEPKGPRKRMDNTLGLWSFDDLGEPTSLPKAPPAALFTPDHAPLRAEDNLTAGHFVNRDRIFDFYAKQAIEFLGRKPLPELLSAYPGLDGGNQGHWGNQNDATPWRDGRWKNADHGVLFSGVFRGANLTIPKAVCVRREADAACFDPMSLSFPVRWKGEFIKLNDARHGFTSSANMAGTLVKKEAPQEQTGQWTYHGFYRHATDTIFSYSKDGREYLATAWEGEQEADKLAYLTKGGPPSWPVWIESKGTLGTQKPFATDTILPPFENPYGTLFFLTGLDFFRDGTAAVCTMTGEVWLVKGFDERLERVRWKRFATGLHQPLGVKVIDDRLYVIGRDQVTRLHDLNDDDEADYYECVHNAMTTSPGGHDYIVGLDADAQGRFYTSSGNQGILRLNAQNKLEVLASGLRNPNGICVSPDGRFVLSSVQEGSWTPASAVCQVETGRNEGTHFGAGGPKAGVPTTPPLLQLPRGEDNSCAGQVFLSDSGWGKLKGDGNFLHFSFGTGSAWLVTRQRVEGVWQAAAVKISGNFVAAPENGRFAPHDGHLYVCGMTGWGNYTPEDGAIHRVRHVGGGLPVLIGHEVRENGVLLRFDQRLDADVVGTGSSHFAQCWNYFYGPAYGSPEYSVKYPGTTGHDVLSIKSAHVLEGGSALFLEIPLLVPANQIHLHVGVKAGGSEDVFLTAHQLGAPFTGFPGYTPSVKSTSHGHAAATGALKVNPVKWETEVILGTLKKLNLQTGNALQYAQTELRAKAGESIALFFENPDIMPHNFVLVRPGSEERVGELSAKMVADPDGYARHYVPETDDVLCHSRILEPGKNTTIYFKAPGEKGRYTYLCSFPGHAQLMRGFLILE